MRKSEAVTIWEHKGVWDVTPSGVSGCRYLVTLLNNWVFLNPSYPDKPYLAHVDTYKQFIGLTPVKQRLSNGGKV